MDGIQKEKGLDPLGMQNTSVALYQRLLPGISNVTLRMRYYGLYQTEWVRQRAAWLFDTEPASGPIALGDGEAVAWLASDENNGIGARFAELVEERPVRRLTFLSPYWDAGLAALKFLIDELRPAETVILIDAAKALFPSHAARDIPASIYDLADFAEDRFVHAKAVIAETTRADHILYGSANCTLAAFGGPHGTRGQFGGLPLPALSPEQLAPATRTQWVAGGTQPDQGGSAAGLERGRRSAIGPRRSGAVPGGSSASSRCSAGGGPPCLRTGRPSSFSALQAWCCP